MDKETKDWLRKTGFEDDRSYYHVWQYRTAPIALSNDREVRICFELSQDHETYAMCVSLEAVGTIPEGYSESSAWLFTKKGGDVKELFRQCVDSVDALGAGLCVTVADICKKIG